MFINENLEILEYIHPSHKSLNEEIVKESLTFNYLHGDDIMMIDDINTSNVKALQTTDKTIMSDSINKIYYWILIPKSLTNYLLIVVGRPIADETPTKRTAGFFPTLSTK